MLAKPIAMIYAQGPPLTDQLVAYVPRLATFFRAVMTPFNDPLYAAPVASACKVEGVEFIPGLYPSNYVAAFSPPCLKRYNASGTVACPASPPFTWSCDALLDDGLWDKLTTGLLTMQPSGGAVMLDWEAIIRGSEDDPFWTPLTTQAVFNNFATLYTRLKTHGLDLYCFHPGQVNTGTTMTKTRKLLPSGVKALSSATYHANSAATFQSLWEPAAVKYDSLGILPNAVPLLMWPDTTAAGLLDIAAHKPALYARSGVYCGVKHCGSLLDALEA